jgi:hypothetical protein
MEKDTDNQDQTRDAEPKALSRRTILRGAAVSAPMVLSLGSTAALAVTSNLISASNAPNVDGNYYCLEADSTYDGGGTYDLGLYPSQNVYGYSAANEYRTEPNNGGSSIVKSGQDVCDEGGIFYYQQSGWKQIDVGNGGLMVSIQAMNSFSGLSILDA